jgi:hypothetical protein
MEMAAQAIFAAVVRALPPVPASRLKFSQAALAVALLTLPPLALPQTNFTAQPPTSAKSSSSVAIQETSATLTNQQNSDSRPEAERLSEQAKRALDAQRWPEAAAALEKLARSACPSSRFI